MYEESKQLNLKRKRKLGGFEKKKNKCSILRFPPSLVSFSRLPLFLFPFAVRLTAGFFITFFDPQHANLVYKCIKEKYPNRWTPPFLNVLLFTSTYPLQDDCLFFLIILPQSDRRPFLFVYACAWVRVVERKNIYSLPDLPLFLIYLV